MTCPDCGSRFNETYRNRIGAYDCPQCKTPLLRAAHDVRPRVRVVVKSTPRTTAPPSVTGYPMVLIDGCPRYRCVVCGEPTVVISRVVLGKHIGQVHAHARNGSAITGFVAVEPTYYTGSDGLLHVSRFRPEIVTGPACPLHEGGTR